MQSDEAHLGPFLTGWLGWAWCGGPGRFLSKVHRSGKASNGRPFGFGSAMMLKPLLPWCKTCGLRNSQKFADDDACHKKLSKSLKYVCLDPYEIQSTMVLASTLVFFCGGIQFQSSRSNPSRCYLTLHMGRTSDSCCLYARLRVRIENFREKPVVI